MPGTSSKTNRSEAPRFTEAEAWRDVGVGWQPLFGSFRGVGYSIMRHQW